MEYEWVNMDVYPFIFQSLLTRQMSYMSIRILSCNYTCIYFLHLFTYTCMNFLVNDNTVLVSW